MVVSRGDYVGYLSKTLNLFLEGWADIARRMKSKIAVAQTKNCHPRVEATASIMNWVWTRINVLLELLQKRHVAHNAMRYVITEAGLFSKDETAKREASESEGED
mmetsp:Transcript_14078/g.30584  ORF Transcript_14078/g.30584 Transcript_14078/m.30584 type:complete len:105 (+) Transcript_14078:593-907(+)